VIVLSCYELGTMATITIAQTTGRMDEVSALGVLENVSANARRGPSFEPGSLEVVRLVREISRSDISAPSVTLVFTARPASKRSVVDHVHFNFLEPGKSIPASTLDTETASIHLYYPIEELEPVLRALRSRRDRFCYFWQAADRSRMRAWLFTPH